MGTHDGFYCSDCPYYVIVFRVIEKLVEERLPIFMFVVANLREFLGERDKLDLTLYLLHHVAPRLKIIHQGGCVGGFEYKV